MAKPSHTPENAIKGIDEQIAYYRQKIEDLEGTKRILTIAPPGSDLFFYFSNPRLTKDFIRGFMKMVKMPVKTAQIIAVLYPNAVEEERRRAIKTLSVIFNNLERDGEVKSIKQTGIKGNYYTWNGDIDPVTAAGAGLAD